MSTPVVSQPIPSFRFDDAICPGEAARVFERAFKSENGRTELQSLTCWFEPQAGTYVHLHRRQPTRTSPGEYVLHIYRTAELRGLLEVTEENQACFTLNGELRTLNHNGWVIRPGQEEAGMSPFGNLGQLQESCRIDRPPGSFCYSGLAGLASSERN